MGLVSPKDHLGSLKIDRLAVVADMAGLPAGGEFGANLRKPAESTRICFRNPCPLLRPELIAEIESVGVSVPGEAPIRLDARAHVRVRQLGHLDHDTGRDVIEVTLETGGTNAWQHVAPHRLAKRRRLGRVHASAQETRIQTWQGWPLCNFITGWSVRSNTQTERSEWNDRESKGRGASGWKRCLPFRPHHSNTSAG